MGYSFVHINKLYSYYKIGKAYEHNYRLSNVSNAISEYRNKNEELISLPVKADRQLSYLEAWQERLHALPAYAKGNRKIRKNAILALEIVTSFPGKIAIRFLWSNGKKQMSDGYKNLLMRIWKNMEITF